MTSKQKTFKVLSIIGNTLFYLLLAVLLLFSISNLSMRTEKDLPNLFGKGFVSILSGSMEGEEPDSFSKGDLVFLDILDEAGKASVKVNDIVVHYDPILKIHIIHRVVFIEDNTIVTQGDVNARLAGRYDGTNYVPQMQIEIFQREAIIGKYTGSLSGVGNALQTLRSSDGFLLWIVLPLLVLFTFEVVVLVRSLLKYNKTKLEKKYALEKEALKQQLLEELKKQQAENNDK